MLAYFSCVSKRAIGKRTTSVAGVVGDNRREITMSTELFGITCFARMITARRRRSDASKFGTATRVASWSNKQQSKSARGLQLSRSAAALRLSINKRMCGRRLQQPRNKRAQLHRGGYARVVEAS